MMIDDDDNYDDDDDDDGILYLPADESESELLETFFSVLFPSFYHSQSHPMVSVCGLSVLGSDLVSDTLFFFWPWHLFIWPATSQ